MPFVPLISCLQRDRKSLPYAVNKNVVFLNKRGWNGAFFKWNEMADIPEYDNPKYGRKLHIKLKSLGDAFDSPGHKFRQELRHDCIRW